MRGNDEQTGHLFSYLSPDERVPASAVFWAAGTAPLSSSYDATTGEIGLGRGAQTVALVVRGLSVGVDIRRVFALEALTHTLRQELAPWGIEAIAIEPGQIATPIWSTSSAWADTAAWVRCRTGAPTPPRGTPHSPSAG